MIIKKKINRLIKRKKNYNSGDKHLDISKSMELCEDRIKSLKEHTGKPTKIINISRFRSLAYLQ